MRESWQKVAIEREREREREREIDIVTRVNLCTQPDSSRNVLIEDLFVSNGDDGIALKSGLDQCNIM